MAKNVLIVVDMQNDFVDGSLGTKEAREIVPNVIEKVSNFDGDVIFTRDTHGENYMETQEGRLLPVAHCIKGTDGWEIIKELEKIRKKRGFSCYDKPTFGCTALAESLKNLHETEGLLSVELVGLCTDICVVSNALLVKAFLPEIPISVDAACCAGVTKEKHEAALETMRSCQIQVKS